MKTKYTEVKKGGNFVLLRVDNPTRTRKHFEIREIYTHRMYKTDIEEWLSTYKTNYNRGVCYRFKTLKLAEKYYTMCLLKYSNV